MHLIAISLLLLSAVLLQEPERPDPAKDEWLMKPTIGVEVVTHKAAEQLFPKFPSSPARKGVYVVRVRPFSSADAAGVQVGDLITTVNGKETNTPEAFNEAITIADAKPGSSVTLAVKPVSDGPKGLTWKPSKSMKMGTVENGRLARISVEVKPDPVIKYGVPTVRDHKRVGKIGPLSVIFAVDDEGYAIEPYFEAINNEKGKTFPAEVVIRADDKTHTLKVPKEAAADSAKLNSDHITWPIDDEKAAAAWRDCVHARNVTVRFDGKEKTLTEAERLHLVIVFDAYNSLKYGDVFKITDR